MFLSGIIKMFSISSPLQHKFGRELPNLQIIHLANNRYNIHIHVHYTIYYANILLGNRYSDILKYLGSN